MRERYYSPGRRDRDRPPGGPPTASSLHRCGFAVVLLVREHNVNTGRRIATLSLLRLASSNVDVRETRGSVVFRVRSLVEAKARAAGVVGLRTFRTSWFLGASSSRLCFPVSNLVNLASFLVFLTAVRSRERESSAVFRIAHALAENAVSSLTQCIPELDYTRGFQLGSFFVCVCCAVRLGMTLLIAS